MLNWWLGRVQKKNIFDIFLIKKMGCFELFLLAQKVKGDDHIFITWMCCSDVEVIVSMYFIFLAKPIWSGTLHHWSQFYREQRRRLLHWETVWCPLRSAWCRDFLWKCLDFASDFFPSATARKFKEVDIYFFVLICRSKVSVHGGMHFFIQSSKIQCETTVSATWW